ncbi:endochitinase [Paracoccidioides lutzii Pb01]|uniref:chitinase n=1 Tax=Paracoccidioides lutzii (strain ATCC MYA-826 / Pb01) TaxID=502779 RepID=C1H4F6_PARBA|nr:endochitinase [Paracoccidioides lutzii Pb01]EEH34600.1 endochitinase [Paracoccidioides lutzii Pb01]
MYPSSAFPPPLISLNPESGEVDSGEFFEPNYFQLSTYLPIYVNAVYYPNWRIYDGKPPSSLSLGYVSHVFYAFAWVKEDGTVYLSDEYADEQIPVDGTYGCLNSFIQLKWQFPEMKILLSIGGGGEGSQNFACVARNALSVEKFVETTTDLAIKFRLDGFDVNWEHPETPQEAADYFCLLARLREQFPSPDYLLTTTMAGAQWALQNINLTFIHQYVDYINLMAFDFAGHWMRQSGHHAQLFTQQTNPYNQDACIISADSGVSYVMGQGVPAYKILLGIPVYGHAFPGTNGINQPYEGPGGTELEEMVIDYCHLPQGGPEMHDDALGAAYCVDWIDEGDGAAGFISYDSTKSVQCKARYAKQKGLGGLFYWDIGADALGERSLVAAGYTELHEF